MKPIAMIMLAVPGVALSQTAESDSLRHLEEITVTAAEQRADAGMTVYIPRRDQREAATDGVSLLSRMNIPQLAVNPLSGTVTTADNQNVAIFINSIPATIEDVEGINPSDVRRVEFMDFPSDPRFLRSPHVVNFITRPYSYGGYTKLSAKERFMVNSGEAAAYSKFAYREMTWDLMAKAGYDNARATSGFTEDTYRFPDRDIIRTTRTDGSRHREHDFLAALRATWLHNPDITLSNNLTITADNIPVDRSHGSVEFSDFFPGEEFSMADKSKGTGLDWRTDFFASLGRGWSLNAALTTSYVANRTLQIYSAGATDLLNSAHERQWSGRGDLQLNKKLSERISVFAGFNASQNYTRILYGGTSRATNRFHHSFYALSIGASLRFEKLSGSIDAGYAAEFSDINSLRATDPYPFTHINLQYQPDTHHSLGIWMQYAGLSPDAAMKNPNTMRQNELLAVGGNPDLKTSGHLTVALNHTWLPDNRWQLTAYAVAFKIFHRSTAIYTPMEGQNLMLKHYVNDGDYNHGQIGARLTGKFLNGSLILSAAPRLLLYYTSGLNHESHYPLSISLKADYYIGRFNFSAYWESRNSYVDGETCFLRSFPQEYMVEAGWSHKGWNLQLTVANIFNSGWTLSHDSFRSRWFDSRRSLTGSTYHRRIALTVAYRFGYGRKLSTGNELESSGSISTSILR